VVDFDETPASCIDWYVDEPPTNETGEAPNVEYIRADLAQQWQPIETVPRNTRVRLLVGQNEVIGRYIPAFTVERPSTYPDELNECFFDFDEDGYAWIPDGFYELGGEFSDCITAMYFMLKNPTHWMPLSQQPKE